MSWSHYHMTWLFVVFLVNESSTSCACSDILFISPFFFDFSRPGGQALEPQSDTERRGLCSPRFRCNVTVAFQKPIIAICCSHAKENEGASSRPSLAATPASKSVLNVGKCGRVRVVGVRLTPAHVQTRRAFAPKGRSIYLCA